LISREDHEYVHDYCWPVFGKIFFDSASREHHELEGSSDGPATRRPRVSFLKHRLLSSYPSLPESSYLSMGNCCGSTATVPSEPQPATPGPVTEQTLLAPVSLPPIIEKSSVPSSSQLRSRPRSRTISSTRLSGKSPQDLMPRSRTKSAPQPPQSLRSSSPHHPRRRARSVVRHRRNSRSDSISTTPGEIEGKRAMDH
jgi:hypothetical protein